jgi:metal-responsive CopG/Arc/MetJ family transcriptional regulator
MKNRNKRKAVTISMPQDMAEEYENLARSLSKNRSVLFSEMFIAYKRQALKEEFYELQAYGTALSSQKGIFTESDVEKLVFKGR